MIKVKRIFAPAAPDDGVRLLVDRLWPRGLNKTAARLDPWLKDFAPSDELRHWFGHDLHLLGRNFTGFLAWLLWLSVHIFRLIGFRNRLLVLINSAWDYLFFERGVRLIVPLPEER
jgi:hypothetical protein